MINKAYDIIWLMRFGRIVIQKPHVEVKNAHDVEVYVMLSEIEEEPVLFLGTARATRVLHHIGRKKLRPRNSYASIFSRYCAKSMRISKSMENTTRDSE